MPTTQQTPQQLANQLARQKKKIEKDRRRKQYEDIQIQGTNNSSIVSKRSVEMLYTPKLNPEMGEWFQYFVKNPKRRSPAINRGYWVRMESIRQLILRIIKQQVAQEGAAASSSKQKICIVNLGCGFDPLPFQLLSEFRAANPDLLDRITFVDIDYPDLVNNKLQMINDSQEILSVIGESSADSAADKAKRDLGIVLSTKNYNLVGCNLRDSALFNKQLSAINEQAATNIFVAEVSLAYMKPEGANPVIENASKYPNSHFIILEQLLPAGLKHPFAVKMMYHFDHLRSSLGCVEKYPLIKDQVARFKQYYPVVEANDLAYNWANLTSDEMKEKVSGIESFDEWEEFLVFCQHYVIVHATNNEKGTVYDEKKLEQNGEIAPLEAEERLQVTAQVKDTGFERKFGAACYLDGKILVSGGSGQTRESSIVGLSIDTSKSITNQDLGDKKFEVIPVNSQAPSPRMGHTFTAISESEALLVGGRGRPGREFSDVYRYNARESSWTKLGELDTPISRHSTVKLSDDEVLIFGKPGFIIYNHKQNTSVHVKTSGAKGVNFASSGFCFEGKSGYIVGGMISEHIPEVNSKIYKFTLSGEIIEISEIATEANANLARIGCACTVVDNDTLVIVGGINATKILNRESTIITYNLQSQKFKSVPVDELLIGFSLVEAGDKLICVGGGGVCYSFGSYYSGALVLEKK